MLGQLWMTKPKREDLIQQHQKAQVIYFFLIFLHRSLSNQVLFHLKLQAEFKNKYT